MKRSIFLAAFGLATIMTSSNGQGFVIFSSYIANGGVGAATTIFGNGALLPVGYQAQLYYAFGTVSDPVDQSSFSSITSPVSSAFTLYTGQNSTAAYDNSGSAVGTQGLGYFDGGLAVIPGYTSGPITFEVLALGPQFPVGRSGSFTMDFIAGPGPQVSIFGDNGQPMPSFVVIPHPGPEPTSLALAGLGGLVSFVMFRRKQF